MNTLIKKKIMTQFDTYNCLYTFHWQVVDECFVMKVMNSADFETKILNMRILGIFRVTSKTHSINEMS